MTIMTHKWFETHTVKGPIDTCWPFSLKSRTRNGYGVSCADFGVGPKTTTAHRVAFFYARGVPPRAGLDVMHACDNRVCCNPSHLSEGTRTDNMRDCSDKGRTNRKSTISGENHHKAKLTADQVSIIKSALALGFTVGYLSRVFGVQWATISPIDKGYGWKSVPFIARSVEEIETALGVSVPSKLFDNIADQ